MRITAFIEYCAIAAGILAILTGKYFGLPKGVELGLCLIGIGVLLAGLEAVYTKQMSLRFSEFGWDRWMGAPAVIFGLLLLVIGLVVIGCAYEVNAGRWPVLLEFISNRPGPALTVIGALVFASGLLIVILADRYGSKLRFIFVGGPQIVAGVLVLTLGIAAIGAGAWEWFDHSGFEHFANSSAEKFKLPPPAQLWRNTLSLLK